MELTTIAAVQRATNDHPPARSTRQISVMLVPEHEEFARLIRERGTSSIAVADERRVIHILDAVVESERSGHVVAIDHQCAWFGEPRSNRSTPMTLVDRGRATMDAYFEALLARGAFVDYFAEDVTIDVVGSGQTGQGRAAVEAMIRYIHEQAFDARAEVKSLIVEGNHAALEADFVGRHIAEFAGVAATGRELRVPYSVVYDLDSDRIKALRIYGLASGLVRSLTG